MRAGRLDPKLALGPLVLVLLLLLVAQQLAEVPGSGRLARGLQNGLHGPWFALVVWLVAGVVRRWSRAGATLALTAGLAVALAIGSEAVQKLTGSDAEWADVGFDLIGAAAASCWWCGRERMLSRRWSRGLAAGLLIVSSAPLLQALLVEGYRASIAPDLVRFGSAPGRALLRANSPTAVVPAPAGWSVAAPVLRIRLADVRWPGVHLDEPIADWRPYAALVVDAYVEDAPPVPITISVRLDHAPVDQVARTFLCADGPCSLLLPLAGLFDRDTARVNEVVIFSNRASAGRVVYLGRVALVPRP